MNNAATNKPLELHEAGAHDARWAVLVEESTEKCSHACAAKANIDDAQCNGRERNGVAHAVPPKPPRKRVAPAWHKDCTHEAIDCPICIRWGASGQRFGPMRPLRVESHDGMLKLMRTAILSDGTARRSAPAKSPILHT